MNISIFGLGYVGCVSMGCLASKGYKITGVDITQNKIDLINQGKPTIIEKDIDKLIKSGYDKGLIYATRDYKEAVLNTDITFISVGTPMDTTGHLNMNYIYKVCYEIAEGIKLKNSFHVIAVRSTIKPGTIDELADIIETKTEKKIHKDFAIISNPEFLREGSAVKDFFNPPFTLIGSNDKRATEIMKKLYSFIEAPIEITEIKVAELIKLTNNSFHALKISFANEVGNICKRIGVDSHELMNIFCKDTQLNISPKYLTPGYAYGGSCLPKDLKSLNMIAQDNYLESFLLQSISRSNDYQKNLAFELIASKKVKHVGIIGLSFKAGTDDLRFSPSVELSETLLGKGYKLLIYDKNVSLSNITGTNKAYIENHIPHLTNHFVDSLEVLVNKSELIVFTQNIILGEELTISLKNKLIIDLARIENIQDFPFYEGICW